MKTFSFLPTWWFTTVTIPTHVTLVRLGLVPFIVVSLLSHNIFWASLLFALAAVTDVIDGALARALNAESELGAILDPLADKALLISSYACLTYNHYPFTLIPGWFLLFVMINEVIVIGGTLYIVCIKKCEAPKPTKLGKLSSFGQLLFIGWLLICGWAQVVRTALFAVILTLILLVRIGTLLQYSLISYGRGFR